MNIEEIGKYCTGCKVCSSICPVNAISFFVTRGHWYPEINNSACLNCEKCLTVCPVKNALEKDEIREVIACKNKDKEILACSTSGGVFFSLANEVIGRGGCVFGCAILDDFNCVHQQVRTTESIIHLQGSKYVQSDLDGVYDNVIDDLKSGMEVLFSGTACQISALLNYVQQKRINANKLFTVEILCYGVPSPVLFQNHIQLLNTKVGSVKSWKFRDKQLSIGKHYVDSLKLKDNSKKSAGEIIQALQYLFSKHYSLRESCFSCGFYREKKSNADLTIGDCWGAETLCPGWNIKEGVSQVIVNSKKGQELWKKIKDTVDYLILDYETVKKYNGIFRTNAQQPDGYTEFWAYFEKNGYEKTIRKYTPYGRTYSVRNKLYGIKKRFDRNGNTISKACKE